MEQNSKRTKETFKRAINTDPFSSWNPVSNHPTPHVFQPETYIQIEKLVELAHNAFTPFTQTTYEHRVQFLKAISKNILNLGSDLIDVYQEESGLSFQRALAERKRTLLQIEIFIQALNEGHWLKPTIDLPLPERKPNPRLDLRKMMEPLGPVVVFGSSNFPLAYSTAGGDTISALASGCPVIVKSHPMHARTGELVAQAIQKAAIDTKMPNGIFCNLNSNTYQLGEYLVKHPLIKAVGFTGSIKGGTAIINYANSRKEPIPVFAEMGSVNPMIVFPNELSNNLEKWVNITVDSISLDAGQFCTNPGLLFVLKSKISNQFKLQLSDHLNQQEPQCMLHPQIWKNYSKRIRENKSKSGVTELTNRISQKENHITPALFETTGIYFLEHPEIAEEVFGSHTLMIECSDYAELKMCIDSLNGQLTGTIIATPNEAQQHSQIIKSLKQKVGRLIFNGVPTGVEVSPAMHHGGPFPATSNSHFGAVGPDAITRWTRPICYQNWPNNLLPDALKNENPLNIMRTIDGEWSNKKI